MNEEYFGLVSVIIPFYNNADWLDEALESVERQTILPLEIIVINDGSNENITEIKEKYKDVIFLEQDNKGAASARNKGIRYAKGQFCAFLDSDDIWVCNKIEKQISGLIKHNGEWSVTAYTSFDKNEYENTVHPYSGVLNCYQVNVNSCRIQTSTVMIRSDLLKNDPMACFAEDMKNGQDIYLWFYLLSKSNYFLVDEPLTKFRLRGSNAHLSINTHVRVRAQLWEKMSREMLPMPDCLFTKIGYGLCSFAHRKFDYMDESLIIRKIFFGIAWICFRVGKRLTIKMSKTICD